MKTRDRTLYYFMLVAEELNISKAAERLFISHQCLSKYLKNLEQEYTVTFFERTPRLRLTVAGQAYLDMLRKVQFLESNLESQLSDIRQIRKGLIRFGTTEGRFRILIPRLLSEFKRMYPEVKLEPHYATSNELCERLARNELDMALINRRDKANDQLEVLSLLQEKMYLVISDHLLAQYFPEEYPACKERFQDGVDLAIFAARGVPFTLGYKGQNSRDILDDHRRIKGVTLNGVLEMTQQDIHFMLAARDFAACFCWAMYLPSIQQANGGNVQQLNVFPVKDLTATNQEVLVTPRGKILPAYGKDLVHLIQQTCHDFASL